MKVEKMSEPIEILLVEDNPGDERLTKEALRECKLANILNVAKDGVEAMSFLRREGSYVNAVCPDLILLDLNLPKKDGREVLAEIKGDPQLKDIPVVVLTVSKAEQDIIETHELKADDYLTKPVDLDQFMWAIRFIEDFWFTIVKKKRDTGTEF